MVVKNKSEQAFLKCGMYGFTGSGKSFTASQLAIGLHKYANLKKPVMYIDTEAAIDFIEPMFKEAKVKLIPKRTRSFADLLDLGKQAEKECSVLIIDSATHFWADIQHAYEKKKNLTRLSFHHWKDIKAEWSRFADWYLMSNLHIIILARAKWIYGYQENDEGKLEVIKEGTGMRLELDFSYEASLLLEMEMVKAIKGTIGSNIINRCWVIKDRANKINGKYFDNPGFKVILPHIEILNLGGSHKVVEKNKSSEDLFTAPQGQFYKRKEIALETIQNELVLRFPTRSGDDHTSKLKILQQIFKTNSWTAIKELSVEKLETGAIAISKLKNPGQDAGKTLPKDKHPAEICREILDSGIEYDISVKKFIYKWSGGKKNKLSDFNLKELKQILVDIRKFGEKEAKKKGGKKK